MTRITDPMEVDRALLAILRRLCPTPFPDLPPETALDAVPGLDSLRLVETVAMLEEQFGVAVDTEALMDLATIGDIAALVRQALPA